MKYEVNLIHFTNIRYVIKSLPIVIFIYEQVTTELFIICTMLIK